ncbi:MAG: discoidin domain-containing protein [Eubacteriales bacterium]
MKKIAALILCVLLCSSAFVSCGGGKEPTPTTPSTPETTAPAGGEENAGEDAQEETEPEAPAFDASKLTDQAWGVANSTVVGALTFNGDTATLNLLVDGEDKSISGAYTVEDGKMTIDGTEIGWQVVASFCKLSVGDASYSLSKADSADAARGPYNLLTNSWSGDGMSLSFDGDKATITVDGGINYTGTYTLESASSLTIPDESAGSSENLSIGATATSNSTENDSYIPELAIDGDYATRFASAYNDPEWFMVDFGEVKKVGAAIIYFEAAYSTEFYFEASTDGENWTEVARVTDNSTSCTADAPVGVEVRFNDVVDAQYIRYTGVARGTTYGHSFWEMELYEIIAGVASCELSYSGDSVTVTLDGTSYKLAK